MGIGLGAEHVVEAGHGRRAGIEGTLNLTLSKIHGRPHLSWGVSR